MGTLRPCPLMRFQNYALLSKTPSIDFRPQHCFDAFSTVHTEKILKTIKLHLNSMRMLQTHAPAIFSVIVFILMRFRPFPFPSTLIRYVCIFVLIHFQ